MPLRSNLVISPPDPDLVAKLHALAETAVDAFWPDPQSKDEQAHKAVQDIQSLTGITYHTFYFHALIGSETIDDFAQRAALGNPPCIPDLDRDEIIDIIERIDNAKRPESFYYLDLLQNSFPYSDVLNVIYWPDRERSRSEMADEILYRKSLFELGGTDAVKLYLFSLAEAITTNPDAPQWAQTWAKSFLSS